MAEEAMRAAAEEFDEAAERLEEAVRHLRTAAGHFRERNVPRGCAHAFAAYGYMQKAHGLIDHRAVVHAENSLA